MKKIITALTLLLISAMVMSTASFAWFSMSSKVDVGTLDITATAKNGLYISNDDAGTRWDIEKDLGLKISAEPHMMPVTFELNKTAEGQTKKEPDFTRFVWKGANSTSSVVSARDSNLITLNVSDYAVNANTVTYTLLEETKDDDGKIITEYPLGYEKDVPVAFGFHYFLGTDAAGKTIYADINWGNPETKGLRDCIAMDLYTAETKTIPDPYKGEEPTAPTGNDNPDDTSRIYVLNKIGTYQPDVLTYKGIVIDTSSVETTKLEGHTHVFAVLYFKGDDPACTSSNAMVANAFNGINIAFYLENTELYAANQANKIINEDGTINTGTDSKYFDLSSAIIWTQETVRRNSTGKIYDDKIDEIGADGTDYSDVYYKATIDNQVFYCTSGDLTEKALTSTSKVYMFVDGTLTEVTTRCTLPAPLPPAEPDAQG